MAKRHKLPCGHWNDCGIIWDWPCDCGRVEEVEEVKEALKELVEPFVRFANRVLDWIDKKVN